MRPFRSGEPDSASAGLHADLEPVTHALPAAYTPALHTMSQNGVSQ